MAKPTVAPTCKYHQDTAMQPYRVPDDNSIGVFAASMLFNKTLQMGRGYTFHVYECPKCTYCELHDTGPL